MKERNEEDAATENDLRQCWGVSDKIGERIARENGSTSFAHGSPNDVNVLENGSTKCSRDPDEDSELQVMESDDTPEDQSTKIEDSQSVNLRFHCTACGKVADVVHQHTLLKVIVCKSCKGFVQSKMCVEVYNSQLCILVDCIESPGYKSFKFG